MSARKLDKERGSDMISSGATLTSAVSHVHMSEARMASGSITQLEGDTRTLLPALLAVLGAGDRLGEAVLGCGGSPSGADAPCDTGATETETAWPVASFRPVSLIDILFCTPAVVVVSAPSIRCAARARCASDPWVTACIAPADRACTAPASTSATYIGVVAALIKDG